MNALETLRDLGVDPKKSLGQNFMTEPAALRRMLDAAEIEPDDVVLEIGPGLGALTDLLAERARRVVAVEIDGRFVPYLRGRYASMPHVEIVLGDILEIDIGHILGADADRYKVAANLPYYITSPILRHLLEGAHPPSLLVVTVQWEVAQRITAAPGAMGLLSVGVQFYGSATIAGKLKPGNFTPAPNVDSAIVQIEAHPDGPPLTGDARDQFFRIARAGFSQPRKQLRNSLAAGLHLAPGDVVDWLGTAGIDPRRRAETLSIDDWLAVYQAAEGRIASLNP